MEHDIMEFKTAVGYALERPPENKTSYMIQVRSVNSFQWYDYIGHSDLKAIQTILGQLRSAEDKIRSRLQHKRAYRLIEIVTKTVVTNIIE